MVSLKNMFILLLVTLATGLTLWSIIIANPSYKNTNTDDPLQADSFLQEVTATIFDKEGKPSLLITTPRMTHYPANNTMHILTPHVVLYRKSPQPWLVEAEYADAQNGIEKIVFVNNVQIHHVADIQNPATSLKTHSLTIFPNKNIASTEEPVLFTQPDTTVKAVGMFADLNNGTIKLLSNAEGTYVSE